MSKILNAEVATAYGCLDTDSVIDGDASHAHVLRELARSTNRLIDQTSPVLNVVFDASVDDAEAQIGSMEGYLSFEEWRPLIRGAMIVPKKSHHRTLDARLIVKVTSGKFAEFQVSTTQQPFDPTGRSTTASVVSFFGTGDWQLIEIDGIGAGDQETEQVVVWARGSVTDVAADPAAFGGPVSNGSTAYSFHVHTANQHFRLDPIGAATWNVFTGYGGSLADSGRFALLIKTYDTRTAVIPPLLITDVSLHDVDGDTGPRITFAVRNVIGPRAGTAHVSLSNDALDQKFYFEISELVEFRIANIAIYSRVG